jgi:hypothetical protein
MRVGALTRISWFTEKVSSGSAGVQGSHVGAGGAGRGVASFIHCSGETNDAHRPLETDLTLAPHLFLSEGDDGRLTKEELEQTNASAGQSHQRIEKGQISQY